MNPLSLHVGVRLAVAAIVVALAALSAPAEVLLISRDLDVQSVEIIEIDADTVYYLPVNTKGERIGDDQSPRIARDCLALINTEVDPQVTSAGLLTLADDQILPGAAVSSTSPDSDRFAWTHAYLGRLEVPLTMISAVRLHRGGDLPRTSEDAVLLMNGDVIEGLIASLNDPVTIEVTTAGEARLIDVPIDRVMQARLIAPTRKPQGRRVWFRDGTVLDTTELRIGKDGLVRLNSPLLDAGDSPEKLPAETIAAILFDPKAVVPLSDIAPSRIEGPPTRPRVPRPTVQHDTPAPLDLKVIEYSGPMTAHYPLPRGVTRFAATVTLPRSARRWGDLELIIRADDREVWRQTLNGHQPRADINVEISASELTIELAPGKNGPIQDRIELSRAVLRID